MKRLPSICIAACAALCIVTSCKKEIEFDACGQIDAVQVTVSAESNGRILTFDVEEGDQVCEGQLLGTLDTTLTVLQIRELEQRILGSRTRMVNISSQSKPNASQLESLKSDLARYTLLLQNNAATQKQVDDLKDKIAVLEAQMAAQNDSWTKGNSSVASEVKTYEIQLDQKKDQLEKCRIKVPVSGTVLSKYAQAGESVTSGKPLFKIADMQNVFVRAYFTTAQLAGMKLGDELTVIPDDGTASPKRYKGTVTFISDQAEFTPKNIQTRDERADLVYAVKVSVPNDGNLRLGMYAYVKK